MHGMTASMALFTHLLMSLPMSAKFELQVSFLLTLQAKPENGSGAPGFHQKGH